MICNMRNMASVRDSGKCTASRGAFNVNYSLLGMLLKLFEEREVKQSIVILDQLTHPLINR